MTYKIRRETRQTVFECSKVRTMMIEISRDGVVTTWPKGTRRKIPVNLVAAWERAMKAEADAKKKGNKSRKRYYSKARI